MMLIVVLSTTGNRLYAAVIMAPGLDWVTDVSVPVVGETPQDSLFRKPPILFLEWPTKLAQ